jgi:8-oxo-dGTP diphosphatase
MASRDRPPPSASGVRPDVVAAGAVVVRKGPAGREVLLVHRPKYDDWAWPKGKQDAGEHVTATAVREVLEETGVEVRLARPLPPQLYAVSGNRMKTVHYWIGRVVGDDDVSTYLVNDEIDEVAWVGLDDARDRLTYSDDLALLDHVAADPRRTSVLAVVRHAQAVKRPDWDGADGDRPLTDSGREQARGLVPVLAAYGITRLVSSDSERCLRTLRPYARDHVLDVAAVPGLNEEEWTPDSVARVLDDLLATREGSALCGHRPVLPAILEHLGVEEEPLAPGEMVVCHHRKGRVLATERHLVR